MTSGSSTADHALSSRLTNSGGSRCTSAAAAAWAKAPRAARSRARANVSQKRSGRSSAASSVTHSRATGPRVSNHCATATVLPVAGPPATSATRHSGWARTPARRGRAIARAGIARHPNFERGTGSGPSETARARTPPILAIRSRRAPGCQGRKSPPAPRPGSGPGDVRLGRGPAGAPGTGDGNSPGSAIPYEDDEAWKGDRWRLRDHRSRCRGSVEDA